MIKCKKILAFTFIYGLTFLFTGCVTMPPKLEKPITNSRPFEASFDTVWDAAIKSLTVTGEFISAAQKDSGLISFQKIIPDNEVSKYALIGKGWVYYDMTANINILITEQDRNHTNVVINTHIWGAGLPFMARFPTRVELVSKGVIEKEYLDKIANLIPGAKTYKWLEEESEEKKTEE